MESISVAAGRDEIVEQRVDELIRLEGDQILGALSHADKLDRQPHLAANGDDDAPLGGAVKLCQHLMPVHCTASVKCRAWLMPFCPVVASSTKMTSWGAAGICLPITR